MGHGGWGRVMRRQIKDHRTRALLGQVKVLGTQSLPLGKFCSKPGGNLVTLAGKPEAPICSGAFLVPGLVLAPVPLGHQQHKHFEFTQPQTPAQAESLLACWLGPATEKPEGLPGPSSSLAGASRQPSAFSPRLFILKVEPGYESVVAQEIEKWLLLPQLLVVAKTEVP